MLYTANTFYNTIKNTNTDTNNDTDKFVNLWWCINGSFKIRYITNSNTFVYSNTHSYPRS